MRFYVCMNLIIVLNMKLVRGQVMIIKFDKYMRKTNNSDLLFVTDYRGNKINALN